MFALNPSRLRLAARACRPPVRFLPRGPRAHPLRRCLISLGRCLLPVTSALLLAGCAAVTDLVSVEEPAPDPPPPPPVRTVDDVSTDVAAIVGTFAEGPMHTPHLLESLEEFDVHYGGVHRDHEASFHVRAFFGNGGRRIWISRAPSATTEGLTGGAVAGWGLHALDDANRFNILLIPEIQSSPQVPDRALAASAALVYAAARDAVLLMDPPSEVTAPGPLVQWLEGPAAGLRDRHGALLFGRIQVPGSGEGDGSRWIGASGAAAGVFSWNDRERGVWEVPAGPSVPALQGVLDADPLSVAEREALNQAQVITLQRSPARLWGGRTLQSGTSPFTFLNVQRLTQYIEARVRAALAWTEGEVMEPEVWDRARADAEAVMDELWRAGAFQGIQPQEAWGVRCDRSTHTQADIDGGRLRVEVYFAPLRPSEFVVRRLAFDL